MGSHLPQRSPWSTAGRVLRVVASVVLGTVLVLLALVLFLSRL
jgi:hypothetical protein